MPVTISRFYKREKLELDCEIITPMFLGNASQEAELRAAPFKGLLRYWWRVAEGAQFADHTELLAAENKLFGSPDEEHGGRSLVTVEVNGDLQCFPIGGFPEGNIIRHDEVKNRHGNPMNIDRFLYLGYGPIARAGVLKNEGKGAFIPGQIFKLFVTSQENVLRSLHTTINCLQFFGAIGGRSRNGWGSFSVHTDKIPVSSDNQLFQQIAVDWQICFSCDFPHRLGLQGQQALLWRCQNRHNDWEGVMNELAEIYLKVRLAHSFQGGGPHTTPQARHALGYPSGNRHGVTSWDNGGRHGSALRLIVRKEADGHRGYILHLPHLFSKKMWPNGKQQQVEIWRKVHTDLDKLCRRVAIEEVRP
jgi:CRISPR-associated protein Cmr1